MKLMSNSYEISLLCGLLKLVLPDRLAKGLGGF